MEAGMKTGHGDDSSKKRHQAVAASKLNLAYYMLWYCWTMTVLCSFFFWVDIVPGFGYSASIKTFGAT